jgi:hypothetical protein
MEKNIHTLIAIDTMQDCMLHNTHAYWSLSLCCLHSASMHTSMHCLRRGGFLPANCTSTLLCLSRVHQSLSSVNICWHRILLYKSGEDPASWEWPEIAIEVVKFGSGATDMTEVMEVERLLPSQHHFNNAYSEFEHTQPVK